MFWEEAPLILLGVSLSLIKYPGKRPRRKPSCLLNYFFSGFHGWLLVRRVLSLAAGPVIHRPAAPAGVAGAHGGDLPVLPQDLRLRAGRPAHVDGAAQRGGGAEEEGEEEIYVWASWQGWNHSGFRVGVESINWRVIDWNNIIVVFWVEFKFHWRGFHYTVGSVTIPFPKHNKYKTLWNISSKKQHINYLVNDHIELKYRESRGIDKKTPIQIT